MSDLDVSITSAGPFTERFLNECAWNSMGGLVIQLEEDDDGFSPVSPEFCRAFGHHLIALADRVAPPMDPVCPRCQERTYVSPRTGRTCVRNECGWRERES